MNFTNLITAPTIAAYWTEQQKLEEPYFGESKFPNKKKLGLELSWIKGARKAPVQLSPSAFDADVIPLKRGSFEITKESMPYFKNSLRIDETTRQQLLMLQESNNAALNIILGNIFDDQSNLMRNASLTREILRMKALTTGIITIADNGVSKSVNYGVPDGHKKSPTVKWDTAATADPLADIEAWQDAIADETGSKPTELLMNSKTLAKMAATDAVQKGVFANTNAIGKPTKEQVKQFVFDQLGVTIYVYDKGYDNAGTFTKFVPDGTVVLMPSAELGNTWFGTTPEEADLIGGGAAATTSIVDTGVALTTWKVADPVTVETKVSQIVLPSFELANEIIIGSVLTA